MDREDKITLVIVISFIIFGFLTAFACYYYEKEGQNAPFYSIIYPILKIVGCIYQIIIVLAMLGIIWGGLSGGCPLYRDSSPRPWWQ